LTKHDLILLLHAAADLAWQIESGLFNTL